MESCLYKQIKNYLLHNTLPDEFRSTKSNFISMTKKYKVNRKKKLMRDSKPVVQMKERKKIFKSLHDHSGRTACWERINAR